MKFPLSWLKQHLETEASLEAICAKLTAVGLEVEGVEDRAAALRPFAIAQIVATEKHPQADRLKVCAVDTGSERLQVVCGAPNARPGLKSVLARPGNVIPETGEALKLSTIRGVESQGMLCAADELKLGEGHDGIIELPDDAPLGMNYAAWAGLDDPIIEINLTPNRPDCAGVYGIARDLAAAGMGKLKPSEIEPVKGAEPSRIKVVLDFPEGQKHHCPLFVGRTIRNIKNVASPEWLRQKLLAIGLRPVSALVDITNYLTFDRCRPLHVFDADKVRGNLAVRPAAGGEALKALNGTAYNIESEMTVIKDDSGVLSLAGIIGGEATGCSLETTSVFIESAVFDPSRTAQTGRALQIISDARYRFERGIDPAFTVSGAELATRLILDLCGTPETVVGELVTAGEIPAVTRTIIYNPDKCLKLIGVDVPKSEQINILRALGFGVNGDEELAITPPSWRPDIEGAADIAEEVIRIKGFEHIPTTSMPRTAAVTKSAINKLEQRAGLAKRALAAQGLLEAVTWSFMPSTLAQEFGQVDPALKLVNPISSDLDMMRPSIMGNLAQAAKRNADRGFGDVGLFEVGPAYRNATEDGQELVACSLRAGNTPRHWATPVRPVDAFDAKSDALAALAAAGAPMASLQITTDAPQWYHPGRSGSLRLGPTLLGYFGELHPSFIKACDADGAMVGCEIFLAAIPQPRGNATARPLLKLESLQSVSRDFAFVVDEAVTADKLVKAIRGADKALIREVTIFDVYAGDKIAVGKKSVALSITLQPSGKALTDADLDAVSARIAASVTKATGAILRG